VGAEPSRLLLYRSYPLEKKNGDVTRAVVLIHGGGRDADNEFRTALAAAFLAGGLADTVLIAPRFASRTGSNVATACRDSLASNELNWVCDVQQPDSWRAGGAAIGSGEITSYDAVDEILRKLARKDSFPNLRGIVVAGHSAGGMLVTRYEMANQVHDQLGVPVTYVVANPNIYAYLDALRPAGSADSLNTGGPGATPAVSFVPFPETGHCAAFDDWPYGLQNRTGYSARSTIERLRKQVAARPTTYLLGDLDVFPRPNWDASCSAAAQGPTRLARGLAFGRYVNEKYGAQHKTIIVPFCGHNARCMFTSDLALPLLFPKQ
jgi:pimeloyl-ACP methyl ester carboxylesterase